MPVSISIMDFNKIIGENIAISKKKELVENAISLMASNQDDLKQEIADFFDEKSLDRMLVVLNDRELQLSILQIAMFCQKYIKFDSPNLSALFKNISAKNFSQSARNFLNALDSMSNQSKIKSVQSNFIKFKQQDETITTSGWIDFNEDSIGLTTWTESEEIFTEVRYLSISDWYMKDNSVLVVSIQNGNVVIEIDLSRNHDDIVPFIVRRMNRFFSNKQSEVSSIIFLANFSKNKTVRPGKSIDSVVQIERILRKSTKSSMLRKEINISHSKLKKTIESKLKKRFLNHTLYLRDSIQELKSLPLSEFLQESKMCLSNCIKNISNQ